MAETAPLRDEISFASALAPMVVLNRPPSSSRTSIAPLEIVRESGDERSDGSGAGKPRCVAFSQLAHSGEPGGARRRRRSLVVVGLAQTTSFGLTYVRSGSVDDGARRVHQPHTV